MLQTFRLTINTPLSSFNPHPTRRPGATEAANSQYGIMDVSILTRPGGRVLPLVAIAHSQSLPSFQSSPDPEAGCY